MIVQQRYTRVEPGEIVLGGGAGGWYAIWAGCVSVGRGKTGTHMEGDGRRKDELLATAAAHDNPDGVPDQSSAAERGHDEAKDLDAAVRVVDLVVHVLSDRDGEDEEVERDHGAVWTGAPKSRVLVVALEVGKVAVAAG